VGGVGGGVGTGDGAGVGAHVLPVDLTRLMPPAETAGTLVPDEGTESFNGSTAALAMRFPPPATNSLVSIPSAAMCSNSSSRP
jgi:hypothetical protein